MREKIMRTARDLGYRGPKSANRTSKAGGSVCLLHIARHGHTVNRDHDVFIADYIEGLGQGSGELGLSLEILTFKTAPIKEIINVVRQHDAAGFVVLGTELSTSDIEAFSVVDKPLVFLDTYHDFIQFDFVDMNNWESVFTIVSHFYKKGHREIGMIKGAIETRNFKLREEGFQSSLARVNLPYEERFIFTVDQTYHGAYEDMRTLIARGAQLPPALFCANDIIACGCLRAFKESGISVPDDVSIIGFDDLPLAAVADPPLTTIQVSKAHIGRMAIQLLTTRIRNDAEIPPIKVLISGKLVERQSVRQFLKGDPDGGS